MNACQADCFVDTCHGECIRPIAAPAKLVSKWAWRYIPHPLTGEPMPFEMLAITFLACPCGCGNLVSKQPTV